jgi:hypothetical protein
MNTAPLPSPRLASCVCVCLCVYVCVEGINQFYAGTFAQVGSARLHAALSAWCKAEELCASFFIVHNTEAHTHTHAPTRNFDRNSIYWCSVATHAQTHNFDRDSSYRCRVTTCSLFGHDVQLKGASVQITGDEQRIFCGVVGQGLGALRFS